ncbi:MAG: branched-chain amino acid ABC transporter permease [Spirochaetales bacterium]|nr:branched-chain amino acid ABC transporter permease [Spirochaetales bacterium]
MSILVYLRRLFVTIKEEIIILPTKVITILFILFLLVLPVILPDSYLMRVLILAAIFAMLTASWDFLSGFAGQLNFGHALFFGVGAYSSALFNLLLKIPPAGSIPLSGLVAVLAGLIIGFPCLRLKGIYLALTTIAFPIILTGVVNALPGITGGELGLSGLDKLTGSRIGDYYIVTLLMLGSCTVMYKLTQSNVGIIFHAIREDEVSLKVSGINTTKYKLLAFCLSGLFAGIAGGVYAHFMRIAGPSTLSVSTSFTIIIYAVFGGVCTIYGSVAAVYILFPLMEVFQLLPQFRTLFFAAIVLIILLYMPSGFIQWIIDKIEKTCSRCGHKNHALRKICRFCERPFKYY